MKLGLTWRAVEAAVGGRLARGAGERPFDSFSTDTRTLGASDVFWALKGERHDAHDHLKDAGRAAGWVVEAGRWPQDGAPAQVLEVKDTLAALQALGAHHRRRFELPVVAITGSNGKTTTKEFLKAILSRRGPVCATRGNLNNHFGVPLSLLELKPEHRAAVIELGANHVGEIGLLTKLAAPTVAILTNIGEAHIGLFGGIEKVFEAKSELPRGMSGPVALNVDDPWLQKLVPELGGRVVGFGRGASARARLVDGPGLVLDGRRIELRGEGASVLNVPNAAAAAAAALAIGVEPSVIAAGLADFKPAPLRLERRAHPTGATILLDAYNANPGSMRASIAAFLDENPTRKKVLVLGDMKELGAESSRMHRDLGAWVRTLPVQKVFLAGPEMRAAYAALEGAPFEVRHADDPLALADAVLDSLGAGTAVFFKASRAMALERLLANV